LATIADTRAQFKTRWHDRRPRYWLRKDPARRAGFRSEPEVVRFGPEPGHAASREPAVRIFLGTEPMQARAERVFLWSIHRRHDPSRRYEIHLMKDLAGFDRTRWTTGFTNYRYAIPALAGGAGRAIYNDVDQIYLADPAGMFDLDMGGAGILCVDAGETSVALIDCAAMAGHWRIADARTIRRRRHFLDPLAGEGVWGALSGEWNARDGEYEPGRSKCVHFTTLRLQPWRPFPDQLRYREHPHAEVWRTLEREADAARFNAFSRSQPSSRFAEALASFETVGAAADDSPFGTALADWRAEIGGSVLQCSPGRLADGPGPDGGRLAFPHAAPVGRYDGAAAIDLLGRLPEDDLPWALDELFGAAERFVFVATSCLDQQTPWTGAALPLEWWRLQMELAAARNPGRLWRLATYAPGRHGSRLSEGGGVGPNRSMAA
jgi:hypothetical protein